MALEWAHNNLWGKSARHLLACVCEHVIRLHMIVCDCLTAIGFNETEHEDHGVPTFMRVDLEVDVVFLSLSHPVVLFTEQSPRNDLPGPR